MKRAIALLLSCLLLFTGCSMNDSTESIIEEVAQTSESSPIVTEAEPIITAPEASETSETQISTESETIEIAELSDMDELLIANQSRYTDEYAAWVGTLNFTSMSEPSFLRYIEDAVYSDVVQEIDSSKYLVTGVNAVYLSKEYLEELDYNSQENVYFGYKLSELDQIFQGQKYIFTLGDDGQTEVVPFEDYDSTYDQMVKNIAIGTGVVLLCVTISAIGGAAGVPEIALIFSASAKQAASCALSYATIGGVVSGSIEMLQTGDMESAVDVAALQATEGFKIGAIFGALSGGITEGYMLHELNTLAVTPNGLTLTELAKIQQESGYPVDVIQQFHSLEEYEIYQAAGLKPSMVNGRLALLQDIDLNYTSVTPKGETVTNLQRMLQGYAPIEPSTNLPYELHHIGQRVDGTLAVLTNAQHQGNSAILNIAGKASEIDRDAFQTIRKAFWEDVGKQIQLGAR